MDNVFIDTDICLDILTQRKPFFEISNQLLVLRNTTQRIRLCISESCLPNLIYFTSFKYHIPNANIKLINWINTCRLYAANDKSIIIDALHSSFKDKEDAIQYFTALHSEADYFITRNKKDYEPHTTTLPVYTPAEFLSKIIT